MTSTLRPDGWLCPDIYQGPADHPHGETSAGRNNLAEKQGVVNQVNEESQFRNNPFVVWAGID
jgi:hypothetical protein